MEQRVANTFRMTVNEKKFIEKALLSDLRIDGRRPFDFRRMTIKFGRQVFCRNNSCVLLWFCIFVILAVFAGNDNGWVLKLWWSVQRRWVVGGAVRSNACDGICYWATHSAL